MILSAHDISKRYGALEVLKNVSIDIKSGSFVAIVGASGAGKSTLLHILGTLDEPDTGKVMMNNVNLCTLKKSEQAEFRNKKMGFVFQFHHLLPEFNAIENVCMPLWIAGNKGKQVNNEAQIILEKLGLGHRLKHKPGEMSGGEQQRVAIARALIQKPMVLFADEPTGNLDTENAQIIHKLFLDIQKDTDITIIVVTHNEELATLADRVITMKDGTIIQDSVKSKTLA